MISAPLSIKLMQGVVDNGLLLGTAAAYLIYNAFLQSQAACLHGGVNLFE